MAIDRLTDKGFEGASVAITTLSTLKFLASLGHSPEMETGQQN
jgi:hypothetical protein